LGRLWGRGAWAHPRCQSHDCLNAICGAAAEGVAQVETGHGEPVGKTHSSERGPSLAARQLGSGHAHAARQRWTAARVGLKRVLRAKGQNPEAQTVWGPFALEGLDPYGLVTVIAVVACWTSAVCAWTAAQMPVCLCEAPRAMSYDYLDTRTLRATANE